MFVPIITSKNMYNVHYFERNFYRFTNHTLVRKSQGKKSGKIWQKGIMNMKYSHNYANNLHIFSVGVFA